MDTAHAAVKLAQMISTDILDGLLPEDTNSFQDLLAYVSFEDYESVLGTPTLPEWADIIRQTRAILGWEPKI